MKSKKTLNDTPLYLADIIISVDNNEWYYGKKENRTNIQKRKLLLTPVSDYEAINQRYATTINEIFSYVQFHEKDTTKRKKRLFYIDNTLLVEKYR